MFPIYNNTKKKNYPDDVPILNISEFFKKIENNNRKPFNMKFYSVTKQKIWMQIVKLLE